MFNDGMVGHGRPATGQRVDVRIPTELIAKIDAEAKAHGLTRAEQIRRILTWNYEKDSS